MSIKLTAIFGDNYYYDVDGERFSVTLHDNGDESVYDEFNNEVEFDELLQYTAELTAESEPVVLH